MSLADLNSILKADHFIALKCLMLLRRWKALRLLFSTPYQQAYGSHAIANGRSEVDFAWEPLAKVHGARYRPPPLAVGAV